MSTRPTTRSSTAAAGSAIRAESAPSSAAASRKKATESTKKGKPAAGSQQKGSSRVSDAAEGEETTKESDGEQSPGAITPTVKSTVEVSTKELQALLTRIEKAETARQSQPTTSSTRVVEVRLREVPRYKGGSGDALDSWLGVIDLRYRNWVGVQGAEEKRFVAAAADFLEDAAVTWWLSIPATALPTTWPAMRAALQKQFQPVTSDQRARGELFTLKQGAKQSVTEYVAAFRRLLTKAGPELAAAPALVAELFVNGLRKADIRRDLLKENVKQLDRAIEMATRLDGCDSAGSSDLAAVSSLVDEDSSSSLRAEVAELRQQLFAMSQQRGSSVSSGSSSTASGRRYDSRRDRGANKTGSIASTVPGLSDAMAKARRENNQCFWCGSKEHTKRDCPDRAANKPPKLN